VKNPLSYFSPDEGNARAVSLMTLLYLTLEGCGLSLILSVAVEHYRHPVTEQALLAFNATIVLGGLIVLYYTCQSFLRNGSRLRILFYGVSALIATLSLIGNFGDDAINQPGALAAFLLVLVSGHIVVSMCRLSGGAASHHPHAEARYGSVMAANTRAEVSEQDRRFIAAHEAGHTLVYAAWSPLPDNLKVVVKKVSDEGDSLGFVNAGQARHLLDEKTFSEWEMLLFLAGIAGERSYTDNVTQGAVEDTMRWMNIAKSYLICHLADGVFYPEPATELEIGVNQRHLTALKSAQNALLNAFFERNRETHARLTDALLEQGTLTGTELHPYLAAVQLPEDFPRLQNVSPPD